MVEICDEQMKVFMTKMYKLDNKFTEMQNDINTIKDDVKMGHFMSKKQGVNGLGVAGMTAGMSLSYAAPEQISTALFLFAAGLAIYILSLFWRHKRT